MEKAGDALLRVDSQEEFDVLFKQIFHHQRNVAARSIDAVEKITRERPEFLLPHKSQLLSLLTDDPSIEMKWHLVQMVTRLGLSINEFKRIWALLTHWAINQNESKLVRVNSLQSLFDLYQKSGDAALLTSFRNTVRKMETERIPSISARIRKLRELYQSKNTRVRHA